MNPRAKSSGKTVLGAGALAALACAACCIGPILARGMHFPVRWDPFFKDFMTLADIYRYPTQHFDFHHRQLTLNSGDGRQGAG
ncbi:hypothetical protein VR46_43260 [Streptomyces sp. NRRL S-444]|nr:hypothetical protein VR46_43260 [Streptomyces sp. NRRL S-444]